MTDRDHTEDIETITVAFGEVAAGVDNLAEVVKENTEERRRTRVWAAAAVILTSLLIILQAAGLYEAREGRDRLIDCTVPEGKCFQEGQERTGQAVNGIVCASAEDTREVVGSIGRGLGVDLGVPPLPEYCTGGGSGAG